MSEEIRIHSFKSVGDSLVTSFLNLDGKRLGKMFINNRTVVKLSKGKVVCSGHARLDFTSKGYPVFFSTVYSCELEFDRGISEITVNIDVARVVWSRLQDFGAEVE